MRSSSAVAPAVASGAPAHAFAPPPQPWHGAQARVTGMRQTRACAAVVHLDSLQSCTLETQEAIMLAIAIVAPARTSLAGAR